MRVDLIVRSICMLRPGVKGMSKGIAVRSILGRFLEHSRIVYFQNGGDDEVFIGSPDMMERNLDRRVEALAAVTTPALKDQLKLILELALSDNVGAWTLDRHGRWTRVAPHRRGDAPQSPGAVHAAPDRSMLEQELKLSVEGSFAPTFPPARHRTSPASRSCPRSTCARPTTTLRTCGWRGTA